MTSRSGTVIYQHKILQTATTLVIKPSDQDMERFIDKLLPDTNSLSGKSQKKREKKKEEIRTELVREADGMKICKGKQMLKQFA